MLRVRLPSVCEDRQPIKDLVERLMGRESGAAVIVYSIAASAAEDDAIDA